MNDETAVQTVIIWAGVALMSVVLYLGLYFQNQATQRIAGASLTQQICAQAHQVNDGKSEQACGNVQDKYHTEFLCSAQGACWTELK
jgi:hypothetical protein